MLTNQQVMSLVFLLCVFFGMGRKESCKTVIINDIEAILWRISVPEKIIFIFIYIE